MRSYVYLAICASLILVGGALWTRVGSSRENANLIAAEGERMAEVYADAFLNDSKQEAAGEPLTNTDILGRQLIMDYLALAQRGEATEKNLSALAEKYIENIPTLVTANKITLMDLNIVSNTQANFSIYANEIETLYKDYTSKLISTYAQAGEISVSPEASSVMSNMSDTYKVAAEGLKGMAVPAALAESHLQLTNTYIENSASLGSISQMQNDPALSLAGMIALKSNLEKEEGALSDIEDILKRNGI